MDIVGGIQAFLISGLKKVIVCAVIIFACYIIYKIVKKLLAKAGNGEIKIPGVKLSPDKIKTIESIAGNAIKVLLLFIAAFSVLVYLGVPSTSLAAVAGIGTVAIGLGCQALAGDLVSGLFITMEDQFHIGDIVTINGITGTVEKLSMRTTVLRSPDGTQYIIPNGSIGTVANMCKEYMYGVIDVSVAYEEDLDKVLRVLNDEMDKCTTAVEGLLERPTVLGVIALNDSSVDIRITAKCLVKTNLGVEREIRYRIKNRLDAENITIPFPQITLHKAE